ncbi:LysE family transporter [Methanolobus sp. ZRKC3]|uniref:LysE family translocator n=1 Tax=Methanolobus sp. ZRKC3 TaxID=3125786 RepID=UPI00324582A1
MSFLQPELIIELAKALILGFTVGISAAMIPGPMMFTTVGIALKKGWRTGLFVFTGHAFVESLIFLLILVGVAAFIGEQVISYMAIIGGIVMLLFGLFLIKSAKEVSAVDISESASKMDICSAPVSAGVLTTALNPAVLIWWLTAGSSILLQAYLVGIFAVLAFAIGHWIADLGVLVAVSSSCSKGKEMMSRRAHERILYLCGGLLAIFGFWFLFNYNSFSSMI